MIFTVHPKIPRWIAASIAKHFTDVLSPVSHVYVEGQKRNTEDQSDWFEIRTDGPYFKQKSLREVHAKVEVNIAIVLVQNETTNAYDIHDLNGHAVSGFQSSICVYKYGKTNDAESDGSRFGCLKLLTDKREAVVVSNFGKIDPSTNMMQSTVEGHYELRFQMEE